MLQSTSPAYSVTRCSRTWGLPAVSLFAGGDKASASTGAIGGLVNTVVRQVTARRQPEACLETAQGTCTIAVTSH